MADAAELRQQLRRLLADESLERDELRQRLKEILKGREEDGREQERNEEEEESAIDRR